MRGRKKRGKGDRELRRKSVDRHSGKGEGEGAEWKRRQRIKEKEEKRKKKMQR